MFVDNQSTVLLSQALSDLLYKTYLLLILIRDKGNK